MAKEGKKSLIQEFKEFALQGNLFDMAVGVLIGGVFKDLVSAFTDNIIMPIIGIFTGGLDFSQWYITLPTIFEKLDEDGNPIVNKLNYGNFISAVINFLIIALILFCIIKAVNKAMEIGKKKEEVLLTEIRDLLKERK